MNLKGCLFAGEKEGNLRVFFPLGIYLAHNQNKKDVVTGKVLLLRPSDFIWSLLLQLLAV